MKSVPVLLVSKRKDLIESISSSLAPMAIDVLVSEPTYTSYLNVMQYLPAVVVLDLSTPFHDQLHFLQMVKQNSTAAAVPVIGFGTTLSDAYLKGLKKIGLTAYFEEPLSTRDLVEFLRLFWRNRKMEEQSESVDADTVEGELLRELQNYREKCLTAGVENEFSRDAAHYLHKAQQCATVQGQNPLLMQSLFERAELYYRKAWLVSELAECDAKIERVGECDT